MRHPITQTLCTYPWGQQLICLLPPALLLCCLAAFIGSGNDLTLYFKESNTQHPLMTRIMRFLTNWTNIAFYLAYTALFVLGLLGKNKPMVRFVLVFAVAQILVAAILVHAVKITVGRPRPLPALDGAVFSPFAPRGAFHAFPSGHVAEISGAAFPLANRYARPMLSLFLGLIIALIGFSRMYFSMHHISDIAGGLIVGILVGLLNHHYAAENNYEQFLQKCRRFSRRFRGSFSPNSS